jgi:hypothetical protein
VSISRPFFHSPFPLSLLTSMYLASQSSRADYLRCIRYLLNHGARADATVPEAFGAGVFSSLHWSILTMICFPSLWSRFMFEFPQFAL